jgi:release factor glutamine methyltransferase
MLVGELLQQGISELAAAGITDAAVDTCLLLGHCLSMSRTQLYLAMEEEAPEPCARCFLTLLARRKQREPVAYILREREFWSLPFLVTGDVLIPRPETEFLLETALKAVTTSGLPEGLLLDLCCGSGVIAVVLARELRKKVIAADLSLEALQVARQNAKRHGVEALVDFVQADLLEPFLSDNRFSLIISNPPYVTRREMENDLEPEIIRYEPHLALDGGESGLDVIENIRGALPQVLCHGGYFFMEIGAGQGRQVKRIFSGTNGREAVFEQVRVLSDYAGRDRVLFARHIRR